MLQSNSYIKNTRNLNRKETDSFTNLGLKSSEYILMSDVRMKFLHFEIHLFSSFHFINIFYICIEIIQAYISLNKISINSCLLNTVFLDKLFHAWLNRLKICIVISAFIDKSIQHHPTYFVVILFKINIRFKRFQEIYFWINHMLIFLWHERKKRKTYLLLNEIYLIHLSRL